MKKGTFIQFIVLLEREIYHDQSTFDTSIIVSIINSLSSSHFEHLNLQNCTNGSPIYIWTSLSRIEKFQYKQPEQNGFNGSLVENFPLFHQNKQFLYISQNFPVFSFYDVL